MNEVERGKPRHHGAELLPTTAFVYAVVAAGLCAMTACTTAAAAGGELLLVE